MSAQIAAHGRLGDDPVERQTSAGKLMATCSIAVDVARHNADQPDTEWFDLVSFGRVAEALLRHHTGDRLAVMGSLSRRRWSGEDGVERGRWSVLVEAIVSARVVRPAGGRKRDGGRSGMAEACGAVRVQAPVVALGDAIPF